MKSRSGSKQSVHSRGGTTTPKSGGGGGEGEEDWEINSGPTITRPLGAGNYNNLSSQSLSKNPSFFQKHIDTPIHKYHINLDNKTLSVEIEQVSELPNFEWKITVPLFIQDDPNVLKVFMGTIRSYQFSEITKNRHLPGWKPVDLFEYANRQFQKKMVRVYYTSKSRELITKDTKGRKVPKSSKDRLIIAFQEEEEESDKNLFLMLYYKEKEISKRELQLSFTELNEYTRESCKEIIASHEKLKRVIIKMSERVKNNSKHVNAIHGVNHTQDQTMKALVQRFVQAERLVDTLSEQSKRIFSVQEEAQQTLAALREEVATLRATRDEMVQPHRVYRHEIMWKLRAVDFVKHRKLVSDSFTVPDTKCSFNLHLLPNGYDSKRVSVDDRYICAAINPLSVKSSGEKNIQKLILDYELVFQRPENPHDKKSALKDIPDTRVKGSFDINMRSSKHPGQGVPIVMKSTFLNFLEETQTYKVVAYMRMKSTVIVSPSVLSTKIAQAAVAKATNYKFSTSPSSVASPVTKPADNRKTPSKSHIERKPVKPFRSPNMEQLTPSEPRGDHDGGGSSIEGESPRREYPPKKLNHHRSLL